MAILSPQYFFIVDIVARHVLAISVQHISGVILNFLDIHRGHQTSSAKLIQETEALFAFWVRWVNASSCAQSQGTRTFDPLQGGALSELALGVASTIAIATRYITLSISATQAAIFSLAAVCLKTDNKRRSSDQSKQKFYIHDGWFCQFTTKGSQYTTLLNCQILYLHLPLSPITYS